MTKDFKRFSVKWQVFRQLGVKRWLQFFIFQRIFRVNGEVPWPVHWASVVTKPERIDFDLGDSSSGNVHIPGYMPGQYIQGNAGIRIGRNCIIAMGVKIISANHDLCDYSRHTAGGVVIGDNCWIGANAVILPNVTIGSHVVIAAGSVVTKSFGGNCVVGGVPARMIKKLPDYGGRLERR